MLDRPRRSRSWASGGRCSCCATPSSASAASTTSSATWGSPATSWPIASARLVDEGILERRRYQERPERFEYRLTAAGRDLWPVLHALATWGDAHAAPDGPPRLFRHRDCGGTVTDRRTCDKCGAELEVRDVEVLDGPGSRPRLAFELRASRGRFGRVGETVFLAL